MNSFSSTYYVVPLCRCGCGTVLSLANNSTQKLYISNAHRMKHKRSQDKASFYREFAENSLILCYKGNTEK